MGNFLPVSSISNSKTCSSSRTRCNRRIKRADISYSFHCKLILSRYKEKFLTMAQPDLSFLDIEAGRPPRDLSNLKLNEGIEVVKGSLGNLAPKVKQFVVECADLCTPAKLYICDGSDAENDSLLKMLHEEDVITPLSAYKNRYCRFLYCFHCNWQNYIVIFPAYFLIYA